MRGWPSAGSTSPEPSQTTLSLEVRMTSGGGGAFMGSEVAIGLARFNAALSLVAPAARPYARRHHARARHPYPIAVQNLRRRQAGAQRGQLRRAARADIWAAGAQWRGQVDPDQHPRRAGPEDRRR